MTVRSSRGNLVEDLGTADGSASPALSPEFRNLVSRRSTKILIEDEEEAEDGDPRYKDRRAEREIDRVAGRGQRDTCGEIGALCMKTAV